MKIKNKKLTRPLEKIKNTDVEFRVEKICDFSDQVIVLGFIPDLGCPAIIIFNYAIGFLFN